jgi:hypothetical protein
MQKDTGLGKVYSVSPGLPRLCLGRKIKLGRIRLLNSKAHSVFYRMGESLASPITNCTPKRADVALFATR